MPVEELARGGAADALADGREAGRATDGRRAGAAGGGQRGRRGVLGRARDRRTGSPRGTASGCCEALARRGQFLRATGVAEWPDGTVAGRYAFIHALYRTCSTRASPSGTGWASTCASVRRLERAYGRHAGEIAGELAMHFEHGRDFERAARYRRQAGERRCASTATARPPTTRRGRSSCWRRCPSRRSARSRS